MNTLLSSVLKIPALKHLLVFLCLLVLAGVTYHNAIHNSFMMDDDAIFWNPLIKNADNLKYFFIPDKNSHLGLNGGVSDSFYRPLSLVLLMILHLFFGDHPAAFSFFNIGFLVVGCFMLYLFVVQLTRNDRLALLTSALFIVHPIHSLLVNYLTASVFTAMLITMLASVMSFLKADDGGKWQPLLYALSLVSFIMSFLFHEAAIGLPGFIACLLYFLRRNSFSQIFVKLLPFVLILVVFFIVRMKFASLKTSILDNYQLYHMSVLEYAASVVRLLYWYLEKLVYPVGIVLIWKTPVIREYAVVWLGSCVALLAGLWFSFRRNHRGFVPMTLAWLLIGFAPVTLACLFQPTVGIMMEPHWVLFASIGFFLLIAFCIDRLLEMRSWIWGVVTTIFFLWISIGHVYNFLWADEVRYCTYWANQTPGFKSIIFYLANGYFKKGEYEPARKLFHESLTGHSTDFQAYNNIGLIELNSNRPAEAIPYFLLALKRNGSSSVIYNNLGAAYKSSHSYSQATEAFQTAIAINPYYVEPRLNLADIAVSQGRLQEAVDLYSQNLKIAPYESRSAYRLVELLLKRMNDQAAADELAQNFIAHEHDPAVLRSVGGLLAERNLIVTALDAFEKAITVAPGQSENYIEAGRLMGNLGKYAEAIGLWEEASRKDPHNHKIRELIAQAVSLRKANP